MSTRQQSVRTYEPTTVERFDDQFWPIIMSLCITATILAATIVTLMAGFWMWVSLMILPAAVVLILVALRFIDSKRLRRSLQLALILSLATHCGFLIFAKQTSIFNGFFLQVNKTTTPVRQQRVIHVSKQVQTMPWMDENPVPSPDAAEPTPEKQSVVETSTSRPQPSQVASQKPTENPQLVRRQQLSRTVPRLGKNLSRLSRQEENLQPKSSEQVAMAQPAPAKPKSQSSKLEPSSTDITRRSSSQSSAASKSNSRATKPTQATESATARNESRNQPTQAPSSARIAKRETSNPRPKKSAPSKNVQAPAAAAQPESPRVASLPSDAAKMERRSKNSQNPTSAKLERSRTAASKTSQLAQPQPERRRETPAIANRQPTTRPSRSNTAATPSTPEIVERPRPANPSRATTGVAEMNPQPMALEKASNGTSGVGRTANFDRNSGSRQSAAMTPSDSMRRRDESSKKPNPNSLALREMAKVPRSAAAQPMPSVINRPDSVPIATRPATEKPAELNASASAALTQSNSDAQRRETSVAKGTGSVDLGPRKIVSDSLARRTEGGGQTEIQPRPTNQQASVRGDAGSSAPSIASENIEAVATDDGASQADTIASDMQMPDATADTLTMRGGQTADSGAPLRSDDDRPDRANTSAADVADASLGRANHDTDSDDEDDEVKRRRERAARALAQNSRRMAGSDSPTVDSEIENAGSGGATGDHDSQGAEISEGLASEMSEMTEQSSGGSRGDSGVARSENASSNAGSGPSESQANNDRATGTEAAPEASADRVAQGRRETTGETGITDGDTPEIVGQSQTGQGLANQVTDDNHLAELDHNSTPGMALKIDAETGPAGISNQLEEDPGIDSRRASRDSPAIQSMSETRFRKQDVGGAPSVSSSPIIAKEAFRTRNQPSRASSAPKTEEAIELGLAFLARHQQEDGSWTLHGIPQDKSDAAKRLTSDTAATGLAILAFQGAGYNHKEFKYAGQLQAAIKWMIENQQETGELYIYSDKQSNDVCRFYSHGIATLAMAEAYGMTQDEEIRLSVQLALDYIADTQHERLGGWRYLPGDKSDTSVTGWMMMAMQSGKLAGLETDDKTWMGIERWLRMARSPSQEYLFRYNPEAIDEPETRHGRDVSPCMTAVGLLMHVYLGWDRVDPRLTDGAAYIMQNLPDDSTITKRDTYYWYYATQIIRHVGGEEWEKWHGALHPLLVNSQVKETQNSSDNNLAGSWDPLNPVPDRWGAHAGRLYVTTMNLLSLEVDYRLLPLHDDTVK